MQDGLPLNETGWRRTDFRFLLQIDFLPRAPVPVRIVHVSGTREQFYIAFASELGASPLRKNVGVEHVAFVGAVGIGRVAQQKNLSQIAGRGVETSGSCCEGGHLIGFGFGELGVNSAASRLENW